jgi:hypothetical protein
MLKTPHKAMFIRWQTHKSGGRQYSRETTRIRAILAKSVRVDGKSRPQYVAVIGSFVAERLDVEARRDFWKAADERLSVYVHDDDRRKIEAALARRVPLLTTEEVEAHDRQRKQRDQGFKPTASAAAGPYLND